MGSDGSQIGALDFAAAVTLVAPHLGESGEPLVPLGEGEYCIALRLGERVVRVAKHEEAELALRREACVLGEIADSLPLDVPRLRLHAPADCPLFTVHEEIRGEALTREAWERMPEATRDRLAADLAHFLRSLHAIPVGDFRERCGLQRLDRRGMAHEAREGARRCIYSLTDRTTRSRLDDLLERCSAVPARSEDRDCLVHCDIAPGHVLYEPGTDRLSGVIDFGDIALAEPARDFIYIYEDFGEAILDRVIAHYAEAERHELKRDAMTWHLLETTLWTVRMFDARKRTDLKKGLDEIERVVAEFGD